MSAITTFAELERIVSKLINLVLIPVLPLFVGLCFLSLAYDWHLARKAGAEAEELEEVWACFKKIYGPGLMPLEGRGYSPYLSPAIPYRSLSERIEKGRESI